MRRAVCVCLLLILSVMLGACAGPASGSGESAVQEQEIGSVPSASQGQLPEEDPVLPQEPEQEPPAPDEEGENPSGEEEKSAQTQGGASLQEPEVRPSGSGGSAQPDKPEPEQTNPAASAPVQEPDSGREEEQAASSAEEETDPEEENMQELTLIINGEAVDVVWESNQAVAELLACAREESVVVSTTRYGDFEQVGGLPQSFSRDDVQTTTEPGDIVLYAGNQLVLFYGSNTWSYTMLGHIQGKNQEELADLLGGGSAVVELKYGEA